MSFFESALDSLIESIGEEVTFLGNDDLNETIDAVVTTGTEEVDALGNIVVDTNQTTILIDLSDLSRDLVKGDIFSVRAQRYKVVRVEKDGEGAVVAYLKETT